MSEPVHLPLWFLDSGLSSNPLQRAETFRDTEGVDNREG